MSNRFEFDDDYEYEEKRGRHSDAKRTAEKRKAEPVEDDYYEESGMVIPPVLFWCIIAITVAMLVVVIFLGIRLIKTGNTAAEAEAAIVQLDQYKNENIALDDKLTATETELETVKADFEQYKQDAEAKIAALESGTSGGETEPETKPEPEQEPENEDYWLDLSGHSEIKVQPKNLFSEYKTYYASGSTVNVRAGNSTDQKALFTVKKGDKVQVAGIDGDWAFVKSGDKYGWIRIDLLSLNAPKGTSKSTAVKKETTSGNLN